MCRQKMEVEVSNLPHISYMLLSESPYLSEPHWVPWRRKENNKNGMTVQPLWKTVRSFLKKLKIELP